MDRSFKTFFKSDSIAAYQPGARHSRYRDKLCNESSIDPAVYLRLLQNVRPHTLIEISTKDYVRMPDLGVKYYEMFGQNAMYNPNGYLERTAAHVNKGPR